MAKKVSPVHSFVVPFVVDGFTCRRWIRDDPVVRRLSGVVVDVGGDWKIVEVGARLRRMSVSSCLLFFWYVVGSWVSWSNRFFHVETQSRC